MLSRCYRVSKGKQEDRRTQEITGAIGLDVAAWVNQPRKTIGAAIGGIAMLAITTSENKKTREVFGSPVLLLGALAVESPIRV